jgi:hypothetical protein
MSEPTSGMPAPDEVRAQVDRMIASDEFKRSPQLGSFLRFVVESVLQGTSSRIKAYTIAVEVLRRDTRFDPQADPIVRVEATRLRRTIDRYYAGAGSNDTIRVALPRGSYIPTFSRRAIISGAPMRPPTLSRLDRNTSVRALLVALIAVIAIAIGAAVVHRYETSVDSTTRESSGVGRPGPAAALPSRGNGLPTLLMPPFEVRGTPGPRSISARSLHDTLGGAFTHFDLVNILLEPATGQTASVDAPAPAAGLRADYRFSGSVEYSDDGAARLLFTLVDVADGSIVWSRGFERVFGDDDKSAAEDKVVRELAGILLQPFGVIYAHQRGKVLTGALSDPRYRCLVDVIDSFSSFDAAQQSRGRDCLEQLTSRDPSFALGFPYLAAIDLREYEYGIGTRAADAPPLERGLVAARRGVELNPESSRAYEMLFVILFARRGLAAAFDAANKSIALNKYDMRSLGAYGARLIASGDIDKGMAMLRQAGDDGTVRPPFEEFFLFLGEYLRNDMADASFHAGQLTNDSFQLGLIARALVAGAKGDRDSAGRDLAWLVTLNPAWRDNLRGTLGKFFYAPAIIDRLANDLAAAGLSARP